MTDVFNSDVVSDQVDGNWANWRSWKSCTRTCGGGQRTRVRTCTSPAPSKTGKYCERNVAGTIKNGIIRNGNMHVERCNQNECPNTSQ